MKNKNSLSSDKLFFMVVMIYRKSRSFAKKERLKFLLNSLFFRSSGLARFIFGDGFGKLVGTGSVVSTTNPCEQRFDFVNVFSIHKARDALQIAAATADEAYVTHFIVCVNVKQNLSGTSAFRRISEHINLSFRVSQPTFRR